MESKNPKQPTKDNKKISGKPVIKKKNKSPCPTILSLRNKNVITNPDLIPGLQPENLKTETRSNNFPNNKGIKSHFSHNNPKNTLTFS